MKKILIILGILILLSFIVVQLQQHVSAVTLGVGITAGVKGAGAFYPLIIAGIGILASIIATFFVRSKGDSDPHKALKIGSYVSAALVAVASIILSLILCVNLNNRSVFQKLIKLKCFYLHIPKRFLLKTVSKKMTARN